MKNKINNQDQDGELKSFDPEAIILDIEGDMEQYIDAVSTINQLV